MDTRTEGPIVAEAPETRARGGLSLLGVLTGIVVAIGAMAVVGSAIALATYLLDIAPSLYTTEGIYRVGTATIAVAIAVQFVSYLWGGYTAGRMARGAGAVNGLLVALIVVLGAAAAFAIGDAMGSGAQVTFGELDGRFPVNYDVMVDAGMALGFGSLAAMLVGGTLGGALGQRWHTRLENRDLRTVMVEDRGATRYDVATPAEPIEGVRVLDDSELDRVIDLRESDPAEPLETEMEKVRLRH